jgi:hypothetical protein
METEIFKDIPWYENLYQVSTLGNIKSLNFNHTWKVGILKCKKTLNWYQSIWLSKLWKVKWILVHRLVAKTFITNTKNKSEVNHKDWNKQNNYFNNLEWVTRSENQLHKFRVLWYKHTNIELYKKVNQYDLQENLIKTWDSISKASRELKTTPSEISWVCKWRRNTCKWFIWKFK